MISLPIVQITNIYLAIVGISWLSLHIYFRFFVTRSEYSLLSIKPYLTTYHLGLGAAFIGMHLVFILIAFYNIYRNYTNKTTISKVFKYLQIIIDYVYWKPLEYIHDIIAPDLPYSGIFLLHWGKLLEHYKRYSIVVVVMLFDFFPKIILAFIFFVELIFYERIFYFVHFLSLILLPIILSILIKLMESFALRNLPLMRKILKITPTGPTNQDGEHLGYEVCLQEDYNHLTKEDFIFYANGWRDLVSLFNNAFELKKLKSNYTVYLTLVTSFCYFVAGLYKFIYLFC